MCAVCVRKYVHFVTVLMRMSQETREQAGRGAEEERAMSDEQSAHWHVRDDRLRVRARVHVCVS